MSKYSIDEICDILNEYNPNKKTYTEEEFIELIEIRHDDEFNKNIFDSLIKHGSFFDYEKNFFSNNDEDTIGDLMYLFGDALNKIKKDEDYCRKFWSNEV